VGAVHEGHLLVSKGNIWLPDSGFYALITRPNVGEAAFSYVEWTAAKFSTLEDAGWIGADRANDMFFQRPETFHLL